MTNTYTRGLAEYIADSTFEVIPQAVVEHAKLLILDTVGAGLLGAALPWSERLCTTMRPLRLPGMLRSGAPPCVFQRPLPPCSMAPRCMALKLTTWGPEGTMAQ